MVFSQGQNSFQRHVILSADVWCVCVCVGVQVCLCVESIIFWQHVGSGNRTQVARLGIEHPYLLSHLTSRVMADGQICPHCILYCLKNMCLIIFTELFHYRALYSSSFPCLNLFVYLYT